MSRISAWDEDIEPIIGMIDGADYHAIRDAIRDLVEHAYRKGRKEGGDSERRHPNKEDMGR